MIGKTIFREEALARRARQEPLEDLLRVTAPHEWVLLAGLGAAVLAVLAWSVFGSVERTVTLDALLVYSERQPGTSADVEAGPPDLEAHAYVTPGQAAQLAAGLPARLQVADEAAPIPAEVMEVGARPVTPPAAWPGDTGSGRLHLVRVAVTERTGAEQRPVAAGAAVRLRIVVGRGSFLSLLAPPDRG